MIEVSDSDDSSSDDSPAVVEKRSQASEVVVYEKESLKDYTLLKSGAEVDPPFYQSKPMPPKQNSFKIIGFEDSPYLLVRPQIVHNQKLIGCKSQRTTRSNWTKFDETRLETPYAMTKNFNQSTRHSSVQSRQTASTTPRHHLFVADFYASASALSEPTTEPKPPQLLAQNFMAKRKRVHCRQTRA